MSKKLAEAALFMSPEALTINELTKIMEVSSFSESLKILDDLTKEYSSKDSALEIVKSGDSRYQMRVKSTFASKVSHLAVSTDISKAVLRTLGLIALKQPVKQSLVVKIIGNKAYGYVKDLVERGFLKARKYGNTKILETTDKFESYFGKQIDEIKRLGGSQQRLA